MKRLQIIIYVLFSFGLFGQDINSYYTPNESSLILDICKKGNKEYLLINHQADSVFNYSDKLVTHGNYATTLVEKTNSDYSFVLGYNIIEQEYAHSRVFFIDDKLYFTLAVNSDFEINNVKYQVNGENYNFFMFEINKSINLVQHLYNDDFDVFPEVFVDLDVVNFLFFTTKPVIYTHTLDSITTNSLIPNYEGYSILCKYSDSGFEVLDYLGIDFFGNNELKYRAGIFYTYQQGTGALLSMLCNGVKIYRNDKLIATTDSLDTKSNVFYPITEYNELSLKPLVLTHDRGYLAHLEGFYKIDDKWTFYFHPLFTKEFCYNDQCLTNEQITIPLRTQLVNYSWENGGGQLTRYPENHNFSIRSCKKINNEIYFLAEYQGNPGFMKNSGLYFGSKAITSLFIAKFIGDNISWPVIIRGIEFEYSFIDFFTDNQFRYADEEFAIAGKFGLGVAFTNDSVATKSSSDMFYISLPKTFVSVDNDVVVNPIGIFPNPATNQLAIDGVEIKKGMNFSIYSTSGKEVMKGEMDNSIIDIATLNNGFYLLKINTENNKSKVFHFVKQ